ncbi:efflux RND transporter permease subunit [Desulfohalobium retbaense]|uniref:Acriflavin resistance protein n=1 Tax=Desulfohalobium retbaense (strain ATCC 49708 / DSM 5692 / JCM 16813 / HR100) TaxID=485915 RepID=C8WZN2_DESRD|nr:efflux RND transporter permease subunit [Desulfohalobium retbaense]ACV67507.1 acriflavin resistance protein [Desulfohalobium retbaense DSM 5692]
MAHEGRSVRGVIPSIVNTFLNPQLPILLIILALGVGLTAILLTPKEEEPQIVVPLADIVVQAPGASAAEVENQVATPLENLLWQIEGVEYVYSISRKDSAVVTVRFHVGQDHERAMVRLQNKVGRNLERAPALVKNWVIKPISIDDVPILNLTLYSETYDDHELYRIGQETLHHLSEVENISRTEIVGGRPREIRVELAPDRLAGYNVTANQIHQALAAADHSVHAGSFNQANRRYILSANNFLTSTREVERLVVGVHEDKPVLLRDVARIMDGPQEASVYSRISFSRLYRQRQVNTGAHPQGSNGSFPAVTLAVGKKKGTNAVWVARNVLDRLEELKDSVIPDGVHVEVTRNYGQTAQTKVNNLLSSLGFAVLTVVVLLAFTLGRREALIVALAVPISFALALFVNYLLGYTINRVTLFALILSLGLVVDDPITNVDNIQRHIRMGKLPPRSATLAAVQEVLPPVLISTLAIIVSFTPMFFITGMMGPYMAPMAANVPLTVIFSTVCALTIVPWLALTLLRRERLTPDESGAGQQSSPSSGTPAWIHSLYRKICSPFLDSRLKRWLLTGAIGLGLAAAVSLPLLRLVPLKMLPFDNKNEFQLVFDMPEGTPLEATNKAVLAFEDYLRQVPEVTSVVATVGDASPIDFNGMVRHYYLRQAPHQADIRVNLVDKPDREMQSHGITLRLRNDLTKLARRHGVDLKIVEIPPGPPVLATVVAEIYGSPGTPYAKMLQGAANMTSIMRKEPGVVDIDTSASAARPRRNFVVDKEKAALHAIPTSRITQTLRLAMSGTTPATLHAPRERAPLLIRPILPRAHRSEQTALLDLRLRGKGGALVPLGELGHFEQVAEDQPIYHKNLKRVVYAQAETAGRSPATAILDMQSRLEHNPLSADLQAEWAGEGEWKITLRVFRDLGLANIAALAGIYILLSIQTGSFALPLLILLAVPLTLLGIMPGFWLLNIFTASPVNGYANPVFFTATAMIGMITLGGIVIRNAVVLIEFVHESLQQGHDFREAILQSGAIRLRPIVLTAMTTALGAWPITRDPIFSGLAWALIFGLVASTVFTLLIVPVTYYALYTSRYSQESGHE